MPRALTVIGFSALGQKPSPRRPCRPQPASASLLWAKQPLPHSGNKTTVQPAISFSIPPAVNLQKRRMSTLRATRLLKPLSRISSPKQPIMSGSEPTRQSARPITLPVGRSTKSRQSKQTVDREQKTENSKQRGRPRCLLLAYKQKFSHFFDTLISEKRLPCVLLAFLFALVYNCFVKNNQIISKSGEDNHEQ